MNQRPEKPIQGAGYISNLPVLTLPERPRPAAALFLKRSTDVLLSAAALAGLSPLLLLVAVAVRLSSPGPVIYASERVGRRGRIFRCYKFRTMVANAEALKASLQHLNQRDRCLFKIANDPRVTRIGRFLRKYSLDELPQLWNVLKGDMSLVGPRPPLASEVKQYRVEHLRRLDVVAGPHRLVAGGSPLQSFVRPLLFPRCRLCGALESLAGCQDPAEDDGGGARGNGTVNEHRQPFTLAPPQHRLHGPAQAARLVGAGLLLLPYGAGLGPGQYGAFVAVVAAVAIAYPFVGNGTANLMVKKWPATGGCCPSIWAMPCS